MCVKGKKARARKKNEHENMEPNVNKQLKMGFQY